MAKILRNNQSTHYYTKDGEPAYGSTVVQARKNNYKPSVTTIIGIIDKFNLGVWKQEQAILSVFDALDDKWLQLIGSLLKDDPEDAQRLKEYWEHELNVDNVDLMNLIRAKLKDRMSKSASLGSKIHKLVELYLDEIGLDNEMTDEARPVFEPVKDWIDKHLVEGISERSFTNNDLGYGGRIDFEGRLKNMGDYCDEDEFDAVIDFKTQNVKNCKPRYWDEMAYQLAAYRKSNSKNPVFMERENNKRCVTVLISTAPDFKGVTAKVWSETWEEMKEKKIRGGIPLEHGWDIFMKAKNLFYKLKRL